MKKAVTHLTTVILFSLMSLPTHAQKIEGVATYKTATSLNFSMDSSRISGIDKDAMQQQLNKALQREFSLDFNLLESSYKKVESLEGAPTAQSSGMRIMIAESGGTTYRNTKKRKVLESADVFGKPFLIDDKAEEIDWKILNEFKQIGNYECQKASFTREVRSMTIGTSGNEPVEEITMVEVVAWFTSAIPVNHGPDEYWGLPGLILEVNNGTSTIICTKVVLNPKDGVTIEIPKGGKATSREEFEKIREEKMQEMMQQYRGKDGEHIMRIRG